MKIQTVFKRYEIKYILTKEQYQNLNIILEPYMRKDKYGQSKIRNIYFDTADYRIIRHSMEKPEYKEKLRLRVYGDVDKNSKVFIELKKKISGIVYKRRIVSNQNEAFKFIEDDNINSVGYSQIEKEIKYFAKNYEDIEPRVYLEYDREAYYDKNDDKFRMTFDFNIKMRDIDVNFDESEFNKLILDDKYVLLEVKTSMGLPNWLLEFLSANKIYKSSFSKYANAYQKYILPKFVNTRRIG